MDTGALTDESFHTALTKGFWNIELTEAEWHYIAKLLLINSEVDEAMRELRAEKFNAHAFAEELVDIVIRTADLYGGVRDDNPEIPDFNTVLREKLEKNRGRPHKHGKRF